MGRAVQPIESYQIKSLGASGRIERAKLLEALSTPADRVVYFGHGIPDAPGICLLRPLLTSAIRFNCLCQIIPAQT